MTVYDQMVSEIWVVICIAKGHLESATSVHHALSVFPLQCQSQAIRGVSPPCWDTQLMPVNFFFSKSSIFSNFFKNLLFLLDLQ